MATNKNTCPNCNADNPMDARYCRHCGFLMPNASKEGNSEQQALAKKVVDLQKQITSVTIELEKSNKTITQLGDERLKLEDCCNRYRCDCKKVEDEVRVLRAARQKAEATANKAKEEVRKAKSVRAELENSNSTKAGLLWLLVIVIVICSIVIFNINSSRNLVKSQNIRLEQQVSDLQTKTNRLSSKNKSLESTNKKLTDVVEKLGK